MTAAGPRATFDCLWCGRSWTTRSPDDLEGWAQLCPDCLGKAGENPFLRFRLRDAIAARARGRRSRRSPAEPAVRRSRTGAPTGLTTLVAYYEARAAEYDDWYLRRGRYARGPIHDAAWNAELDGAGTLARRAADPAARSSSSPPAPAGGRRSSPRKGELWLYDARRGAARARPRPAPRPRPARPHPRPRRVGRAGSPGRRARSAASG